MKLLIALNVLGVALFAICAVFNGLQNNWFLVAIWSVGALCFVGAGVMNYKTFKLRGY